MTNTKHDHSEAVCWCCGAKAEFDDEADDVADDTCGCSVAECPVESNRCISCCSDPH